MKSDEKVAVSVVFEPELLAQVDEQARLNDMNRSQFLRSIVRKEFKAHPLPVAAQQQEEVPA